MSNDNFLNEPAQQVLDFQQNGFCLLKNQITSVQIEQLLEVLEKLRGARTGAGLRNLLIRSPEIKGFAKSGLVYGLACQLLGSKPIPVRAILFDKTPATNWYVTWHQDLSIPVRRRIECDGYGSWSVKDDVVHVQPPAAVLEVMVSLRIHLDACSEINGPIKFIPESHLSGILKPSDIERWRAQHKEVVCTADSGDIIAMRPLILHSSSIADSPEHRRVLHLEYASSALAAGLQWAEA